MKSRDEIEQAVGKDNDAVFRASFGDDYATLFSDYKVEGGDTLLKPTKEGIAMLTVIALSDSKYKVYFDESITPKELTESICIILAEASKYLDSNNILIYMQAGLDAFPRLAVKYSRDNSITFVDVVNIFKDANKAQLKTLIEALDKDLVYKNIKHTDKVTRTRQSLVTALCAKKDKDIFKCFDKAFKSMFELAQTLV